MQAVFHLILVGELLAIALTVFDSGVMAFNWNQLGVISILVQWIVLTSAACICPMRTWLSDIPAMFAGTVCYLLVLVVTVIFSAIGYWAFGERGVTADGLLKNLMLAAVFAGIVLRYFYLQQQLRNQQQAELNARIQALQARIRPHFLFNSMNSIASLIDFDPQAAEKMVVDLSALFRASLSEPGLIPLERELDLCKRFVEIEQMRIGDRLHVDWQIPSTLDCLIPSLLLQPLVENAVYHGIQPLPEGGVVEISVTLDAASCHVRVVNPIGDDSQRSNKGNGVALENIRHRLDAHYAGQGKLNVRVDDDAYQVDVWFPRRSPNADV